jgi:MFS family permease
LNRLSARTWFVLFTLAFTGQIAWAVENSWFNTFVYDMLTPDPRPVAWMTAASAVTATLTTLLIGTLSDRSRSGWGRRKPFILVGYILWGLSTIAFPTVAFIKIAGLAVVMVVIADSVMTFFGSTANDAAFNAWTADIATTSIRGRIEGVLNLAVFLAQIVAMVAAGALIDKFGYFLFFYVLGGIVMLSGLTAGFMLKDTPAPAEKPTRSFLADFADLFRWETVTRNRDLFLLLLFIMLAAIGSNVSMPYLIIYLENFIGMTKTEFSIVGGTVLLGSALVAVPFGLLADRWDRRKMLILAILVSSAGGVAFSLMRSLLTIAVAGFFWQAFSVAIGVASVAWLKDLLPEESRGRFLGVRMIFWIAIPMVIGPIIGSWLIQTYGIPVASNGQAGFIPVPVIFQVGALVSLLSLVPLFVIRSRRKAAEAEKGS